jgi:hypothetical protein
MVIAAGNDETPTETGRAQAGLPTERPPALGQVPTPLGGDEGKNGKKSGSSGKPGSSDSGAGEGTELASNDTGGADTGPTPEPQGDTRVKGEHEEGGPQEPRRPRRNPRTEPDEPAPAPAPAPQPISNPSPTPPAGNENGSGGNPNVEPPNRPQPTHETPASGPHVPPVKPPTDGPLPEPPAPTAPNPSPPTPEDHGDDGDHGTPPRRDNTGTPPVNNPRPDKGKKRKFGFKRNRREQGPPEANDDKSKQKGSNDAWKGKRRWGRGHDRDDD